MTKVARGRFAPGASSASAERFEGRGENGVQRTSEAERVWDESPAGRGSAEVSGADRVRGGLAGKRARLWAVGRKGVAAGVGGFDFGVGG